MIWSKFSERRQYMTIYDDNLWQQQYKHRKI